MSDIFIDDERRKRIVSFWIPVCLGFLHLWATILVISATIFGRTNSTIESMFSSCGWGIAVLIFLLISNRGLELVRLLVTTKISAVSQVDDKQVVERDAIKTNKNKRRVRSAISIEEGD